jgi:desmuslin
VSGSLKEELALLTRRGSDSPQNISVDIKKVHQSSDNGTTTIVAELKSSTTLDDSGQLGEQGDDVSEEQIMAALCASNLGAEGGYTLDTKEMCWVTSSEGQGGESSTDVTEKHINLRQSEKSFPFQMDVNNGQGQDPPLKVTHKTRVATVYLESNEDEF